MKTLLEKMDDLSILIRQLQKMESKLRSGQVIDAWRETNRIISALEQDRNKLVEDAGKKMEGYQNEE